MPFFDVPDRDASDCRANGFDHEGIIVDSIYCGLGSSVWKDNFCFNTASRQHLPCTCLDTMEKTFPLSFIPAPTSHHITHPNPKHQVTYLIRFQGIRLIVCR
jgi:hypothetical protein